MKNPAPVNLLTQEKVRAGGWAAESRDADGHVISMHAPFDRDEDIVRYVRECTNDGETVTIWPVGGVDV